ncbi:hypothetical protein F5Y08DRAFT_338951 [Xylaria arbuscula]|nr:hypothetical protein F5Y08DRAFT_338951 [Xylaria arbuscula]
MDRLMASKASDPQLEDKLSESEFLDMHQETLSDRTEEKGHTDAVQAFRTATLEFLSEWAILAETQATLESILKLTEDEPIRAEFAAFVDAPLETAEQQATARATLCQILGVPGTVRQPRNSRVIFELNMKIPETAAKHWGRAGRETFRSFSYKFQSLSRERDPDEEKKIRESLFEMAEPVEHLQDMLLKLWHEQDNPVW